MKIMCNTIKPESSPPSQANTTFIHLPTRGVPPADYCRELHRAITRMKLLVFERRSVDLEEEDTYALYMLTALQQDLAEQHSFLRDPKEVQQDV